MKRAVLAIVSTIAGLIMLLSFKTQSTTTSLAAPPAAVSTPSTGSSASATPKAGTAKTGTATTYTGTAADTRYGPVQVAITVKNGTVTTVSAVEYPQNDPRDQQINSYAIPQLNSEALSAKTAHIDVVSGATYTSAGYTTSLQSALDKAGL